MSDAQKKHAGEIMGNLHALKQTPAFAWFIEQCIKPAREKADKALRARETTPEQREIAAHVTAELDAILEWPESQWQTFKRILDSQ